MIRKPIWKIYPVNSWPEILLLLLKALISISASFSPTRLTSWALSSSTDLSLTISCLSTGLKLALIHQKFNHKILVTYFLLVVNLRIYIFLCLVHKMKKPDKSTKFWNDLSIVCLSIWMQYDATLSQESQKTPKNFKLF